MTSNPTADNHSEHLDNLYRCLLGAMVCLGPLLCWHINQILYEEGTTSNRLL